jgi:hypothetical protein
MVNVYTKKDQVLLSEAYDRVLTESIKQNIVTALGVLLIGASGFLGVD